MKFTPEEIQAFRAEYGKGANDSQFSLFIAECEARNLRPGPHLVFQLRNSKEWDATVGAKVYVKRPYWITTISALRLIAQRTGDYAGQGTEEYVYLDKDGNPSIKSEIPLPDPEDSRYPRRPWVARARVFRKGFAEPMVGLARFDAYAGTMTVNNETVLTDMWAKRGPEQLFKCAEALALRKAFPEELGSLYLAEEIKDEEAATPAEVTPTVSVPLPPPVPKVDQTPAKPVEAPRPNEEKRLGPNLEQDKKFKEEQEAAVEEIVAAATDKFKEEKSAPKKRGRKPKSPENGQIVGTELTEEDLNQLNKPTPPPADTTQLAKEAQEFVEGVTSFTNEQAAAQGLPDPPDPLPDDGQKKDFADKARKWSKEAGVDSSVLGAYALKLVNKTSSRFMTVGDWNMVFGALEAAKAAGSLVATIKGS